MSEPQSIGNSELQDTGAAGAGRKRRTLHERFEAAEVDAAPRKADAPTSERDQRPPASPRAGDEEMAVSHGKAQR